MWTWFFKALALSFFFVFPAMKVQLQIGVSGLILYACTIFLVLFFGGQFFQRINKILQPYAKYVVTGVILLFLGVSLFTYPYFNQTKDNSDADEALNVATEAFLVGNFPYVNEVGVTRLWNGNPITPLPGALILAAPFVLFLGAAIYQTFFWLVMFYFFLRKHQEDFALIIWLLTFGAVKVLEEIFTGGDYISNALYITFLSFLSLTLIKNKAARWQVFFSLILFGISLSSRLNFVVILPAHFLMLKFYEGCSKAIISMITVIASFALVTLPIFFWNPTGFSPLHTVNKLNTFDGIWSHISLIILGIAFLVSFSLIFSKQKSLPAFARHATLALLVPVIFTAVLYAYYTNNWQLIEYSGYSLASFFYALFWLIPQAKVRSSDTTVQ